MCQFIWLIIFLVSICLTIWLISLSVLKYFDYQVVTETNIVYELPSEFPTVTICDYNALTTQYAEKIQDALINNNTSINIMDFVSSPSFDDETRKQLGFSSKQIYRCQDLETGLDCSKNFKWSWSYEYGNCWSYNTGFNLSNDKIDLKKTNSIGKNGGLNLVFYPLTYANKYITNKYWEKGLVVFIHNNTHKPRSTDASFIETGKASFISVKKVFTKKYPNPYSDCIDLITYKSTLYDLIMSSNGKYRQLDCIDLCKQQFIINKCGCYSLEYPNFNNHTKPCLNYTNTVCKYEMNDFKINACFQDSCPLECESVFYESSLSSVSFNLEAYNILVPTDSQNKITIEYVKSVYSTLYVFYSTLQYTQLIESPSVSISDVLSEIGGSLGLFV